MNPARSTGRGPWCRRSVFILLIITLAYFVHCVHNWTYVWQHTEMRGIIRPQTRNTCALSAKWGPEDKDWVVSSNTNQDFNSKKLKIALLEMHDDWWQGSIMGKIRSNRQEYANRHGYTLVNGNDFIDRSRSAAWAKLPAAQSFLSSYDYVFYIDTDAVIMNMNVRLEDFIKIAPDADFILTSDKNGLNTGLMLMRSSIWTKDFLGLAYKQIQLSDNERAEDGTPYPFEYEQRAFHYLWGTEIWLRRGLPTYKDSAEVQKHFAVLPQCAFNSYSIHPLSFDKAWVDAHYADGDFAIHFAGVKGAAKQNLMDVYLERSKESPSNANTRQLADYVVKQDQQRILLRSRD